ncbi:MAG: alanine--glyoxylate aminotransferase family protein [Planctomycetes bacterium]|nr:alanine--glyoxylate aminotransferase family protein [Planctomycetota bacterium]
MSETPHLNLDRAPARTLMGPGPSNMHPRVYAALSQPVVGHMDPLYFKVMDEAQARLRTLFGTRNDLTLALPTTGMGAMEASLVNLIEPGDEVLVGKHGVFSGRMTGIAERCGGKVRELDIAWGRAVEPAQVEAELKSHPIKLVCLVHAETSTGVIQNRLPEIAKICHAHGALLLVDTVASLGGVPFHTDEWDLDAVYTGSQKCLSVPPGIAPLTFGKRAEEKLKNRKTPVQSWFFDLTLVRKYWNEERIYHHTGPVNMTYALLEGLRLVDEEGLEARWARHAHAAKALHAGLEAMGLALFVKDPALRCPTVTTVEIPAGADDVKTRKALLEQHGLEIGGGLGALKGKGWRVGLMGEGAVGNHVLLFLGALGGILNAQGVKIKAGAGLEAAGAVLNAPR